MEIRDQKIASVRYVKERQEKESQVGKQFTIVLPLNQIDVITPQPSKIDELFKNPEARETYAQFTIPEGFEKNQLFTYELIPSLNLSHIDKEAFYKTLEESSKQGVSEVNIYQPWEPAQIERERQKLVEFINLASDLDSMVIETSSKKYRFQKG